MSIKELIYAEIDRLETEKLVELYELIKRFTQIKTTPPQRGALSKLKQIKIQAPEDFSANLDLYRRGEK
jgi:hypothetical protein